MECNDSPEAAPRASLRAEVRIPLREDKAKCVKCAPSALDLGPGDRGRAGLVHSARESNSPLPRFADGHLE